MALRTLTVVLVAVTVSACSRPRDVRPPYHEPAAEAAPAATQTPEVSKPAS